MGEHLTGQFIVYDENDRPAEIFEYTPFYDASSKTDPAGQLAGRTSLRTADGRSVTKSGDTFLVIMSGQILHATPKARRSPENVSLGNR